ncbi:MAG: hypothetical protein A2Z96_05175 [Spirochaetes bacterium GWB1_48_6]|nr:MAG: hypothetical protein A2Z96_05175 [Spirochaetes bacterium GWB1_48_6]
MTIAFPEALYGSLVILGLLVIILYRTYKVRKGDLSGILGEWRVRRFLAIYRRKSLISGISLVLGFLFMFLSLAGVSWGNVPVEDPRSGLDLALVLDVSRSMDAQDIKPSRLKKSLDLFKALVSNLPGARFSFTVYKGSAQVLSPLTQDINLLENLLDTASTEMMSTPGSHLAEGLKKGFSTFSFPSPRYKILILASDGESWEGDPLRIAQESALQDKKLFILGVGSSKGSSIPTATGPLQEGDREVETRLDTGFLTTLAKAGRGEYFDLSEPGVFNRIKSLLMETSGNIGGVKLESVNRYRIFLLLGLFFLTLSMVVRIIRWKKIF